jgi:hypothetical protein
MTNLEKKNWLKEQVENIIHESRTDRGNAEYQLYSAAHDGRIKYPDGTPVTLEDVDEISVAIPKR